MDEVSAPAGKDGSSRPFWIGIAFGAPILALGVRGMFANAADAHPAELTRWIAGSAIVHDAIVLPLVALLAVTGRRIVPTWAWPAVRWGLATTAILLVVSRPFVARWGYDPAKPTALSRNYGLGVSITIALVWVAAAAWSLVMRYRPRADP